MHKAAAWPNRRRKGFERHTKALAQGNLSCDCSQPRICNGLFSFLWKIDAPNDHFRLQAIML
jgi:hypothetical protein